MTIGGRRLLSEVRERSWPTTPVKRHLLWLCFLGLLGLLFGVGTSFQVSDQREVRLTRWSRSWFLFPGLCLVGHGVYPIISSAAASTTLAVRLTKAPFSLRDLT
jgi:hypothetical protein